MDRTNEYRLYTEATETEQKRTKRTQSSTAEMVAKAEEDVATAIAHTQNRKGKDNSIVMRAEESIRQLFVYIAQESDSITAFEAEVRTAMKRRGAALSMQLARILRHAQIEAQRSAAVHIELENRNRRKESTHSTQQYEHEQTKNIQREEVSEIRRREMETVELHINELGKMVSEVSMHISMQGEKIQRIDELFAQSRKSAKKGRYELEHALRAISAQRTRIYTIFAVLFLLLLLRIVW